KPFNHGFGPGSIRHLGGDHLVLRVVSANYPALTKIRRIFFGGVITLARIGMDENRARFGVRTPGGDCREGKENHTLSRLSPAEAVAAGITSRRIGKDDGVIRRARPGARPGSLRDFRLEWNHSKLRC